VSSHLSSRTPEWETSTHHNQSIKVKKPLKPNNKAAAFQYNKKNIYTGARKNAKDIVNAGTNLLYAPSFFGSRLYLVKVDHE